MSLELLRSQLSAVSLRETGTTTHGWKDRFIFPLSLFLLMERVVRLVNSELIVLVTLYFVRESQL